jgi:predicted ATPase
MSIFIHGLGLRGYRGIGPDWQFMPSFQKFNFFIGANNSGKSTVLNFISRQLPMIAEVNGHSAPKNEVERLEYHGGLGAGQIGAALAFPVEGISMKL